MTELLHTRACRWVLPLMLMTPATSMAQSQNPSPMQESTRAHERLERLELRGVVDSVSGPGSATTRIFVPDHDSTDEPATLVIHFHGAAWLAEQSVAALEADAVSAVVNVGAGSMTYDRAFSEPETFRQLVDSAARIVTERTGRMVRADQVVLTAFSAGHGAVRAILRDPDNFVRVGAVLLLDGMHTSYIPERTVLADGGTLDESNLVAFAELARAAIAGKKRFVITHSEIFPGTFASTTETADWLITELGLTRQPVLTWGPRGMQQLSEVSSGAFLIQGFAGNTAPDHVDHFHAMPEMLVKLMQQE